MCLVSTGNPACWLAGTARPVGLGHWYCFIIITVLCTISLYVGGVLYCIVCVASLLVIKCSFLS